MGQISTLKKKKKKTPQKPVFGSSQGSAFMNYLTKQNCITREEFRQPLESVEMRFG